MLLLSLGTSILPPSLNFFNIGNKKDKQESKSIRISTEKVSATNTNITETQKQETCQKNMTKVKSVISDKKKMPSTIHKNITKLKTTASTVQALKKKYQEQRLAKQRIKNKFKTTCVMRTRSCTERAMLKAGIQLAPRKFLPRIETKRHGLRSGVLPDKTKSLSKTKVLSSKPKKKVNLKSKNSDTSNTDTSSEEENHEEEDEEENLPAGKSTTQIKRNVQKSIQKKICTRSKSEMRRVTRSYSGTISSQNLTRRPTRKTKEAAAVYMEILGRKLVSPDLENDDNGSVESFPELPNARRIAQTESELKAKVKQTRTIGKTKDSKTNSFNGNKRLDKSKNKLILKSKRLMRVQRYCEEISDDESESSIETNNTRPITRQSLGKVDKPISRSLRSSSKNTTLQIELQSNTNSKLKAQVQNNMKSIREKFAMKRKRDQNISRTLTEKTSGSKQKTLKTDRNENAESEEETLGMLLNKIKKKKENDDEEGNTKVPDNVNDIKEDEVVHNKVQITKPDSSLKVSDDEESFHGFTKKAISKVLTSFQTHANTNLLTTETDEKLNLLKTLHVPQIADQSTSQENKEEAIEASSPVMNLNDECSMSMQDQKSVLDLSIKTQSSLIPSAEQMEKKCNHENEISANLIDMSSLSVMHTRKEQENMSTERIKKWLNESSLAKEESKLEMENVSTFRYDPTEKLKTDVSHLSISTKIQHLVRPVNVTVSKLTDKTNMKDRMGIHNRNIIPIVSDNVYNIDVKLQNTIDNKNKINVEAKEIVKNKSEKTGKDVPPIEDTSDTISKSDQNSIDGSIEKKSSTEKKIFQPRKPFLPKVKERKTVTPNANAFSPENESSVYAFESDTEVPISTPFRRKIKETAKSTMMIATSSTMPETKVSTETNKLDKNESEASEYKEKSSSDGDILGKKEQETQGLISVANTNLNMNKFELPKNFASLSNVQILPLDKLTTNWSNVNCSASIAVQVNLDETIQEQENNQQRSTEISTQTDTNNENDDDNDGQLFYIPLQAVTRNGPNLVQGQQLIQGVAVKLGTEGPTGPNQRVLLRAKLVTKPPLSVARCPPIGTVQPTTRSPPTAITVEQQVPSTSTITTASATMTNIPTIENTQPTSSQKNDVPSTNPNRQNVSTSANNTLEKLTKSPKSSRERKASIDSTKSGKRYYLIHIE